MIGLSEPSGQHHAELGAPVLSEPTPLMAAVFESLLRSGHGRLRQLIVSAEGSTIVLAGTVSSFYLKQIAQEAVINLPGVATVRNEIRVVTEID